MTKARPLFAIIAFPAVAFAVACAAGPGPAPEEAELSPDDAAAPVHAEAEFVAEGGDFVMTARDVAVDPQGCRASKDGQWALHLPAPPSSGPWTATETFASAAGTFDNAYTCEGAPSGFECVHQTTVDYAAHRGVDAKVELVVTYEGRWNGAQSLDGAFDLLFSCEGDACDAVAEQWTVQEFPCGNSGQFTGTRR